MIVIACLLMACSAMAMARRGHGVDAVVTIPLLPHIVELRDDPYYYHSGYYYHYNHDRWYYSKSRHGPWADLPRDHYPYETRYKGKSRRHGNDRGRDNDDRDRDRDDRSRNKWDDNRGHDNRR